ncbi:MAG: SWIM zinc finger family protein [Epibacterium sp.]|nr:SWIM zinc finger family protein [Epibacterium sp.]
MYVSLSEKSCSCPYFQG